MPIPEETGRDILTNNGASEPGQLFLAQILPHPRMFGFFLEPSQSKCILIRFNLAGRRWGRGTVCHLALLEGFAMELSNDGLSKSIRISEEKLLL